jgi:N-acyl-D-aspartate/D-glutamate deacylase
MYDLLIKNGTIVDGSGRPMYRADVAVRDGKIVALGDLSQERAEREIDATAQYVTPGFIRFERNYRLPVVLL